MAPHPIISPTLIVNPPALYGALRVGTRPAITAARRAGRVLVDSSAPVVVGFACLGFAALSLIALHVLAPATLNPTRQPLSDYALADGVGWLFPVSVGFLAVGAWGAMLGLARSGLLGTGLLRLALGVIVVSAIVAAVFPTDEGFPLSLTAEIHRYAAITLFITVPIATAAAATALGRDEWLFGLAVVSTGLLVVFLLSHLAVMPQAMQDLRGLFQRALIVVDLAVLGRLCTAARRLRPRPDGGTDEHNVRSAGHDVPNVGHNAASVGHGVSSVGHGVATDEHGVGNVGHGVAG